MRVIILDGHLDAGRSVTATSRRTSPHGGGKVERLATTASSLKRVTMLTDVLPSWRNDIFLVYLSYLEVIYSDMLIIFGPFAELLAKSPCQCGSS